LVEKELSRFTQKFYIAKKGVTIQVWANYSNTNATTVVASSTQTKSALCV
jgi:hypothetical protein